MGAKKTILTVICCNCKKFIEEKDGEGVEGISHGFCDECAEKKMAEFKALKLKEVA